ncbi:MAG TPA: ferritin-like domain-containing protein, partial [Pseudonocardiaceae bacterium]
TARTASDDVAERAVTLGNAPDGRALTIAKESPLADVPAGQVKDTDALAHIVAVLTTVIDRIHERIGRLDGDLVTQDLLIGIVAGLEKQRWMLRAQQA